MRPQLQHLFSLLLISATAYSVVAVSLPHESNSAAVEKRVIDVRTPQESGLSTLGSASSDYALVTEEKRVINVGLILGALENLGQLAATSCSAPGTPAAIVCIAAGMSLVAGALTALWKGFFGDDDDDGNDDLVQHFQSLGMVVRYTGALLPDTSILLAEHTCTGVDCNQLFYLYNSTTNTKKVSVVPKMSSKRQEGDVTDGDPGPGGFFMDYVWNQEVESTEVNIVGEGTGVLQEAISTAYLNTTDDLQYANSGSYCASFYETSMGFATQGAVFQNQGAAFGFQEGQAEAVISECPF